MFQIFDLWPHFGLMAKNGPKLENVTPPTVFELGPSNFQGFSWVKSPQVVTVEYKSLA